MWQVLFRVWVAALIVTTAVTWVVLRPDLSIRTLWHSRVIQSHGSELSDRTLREGTQLRAFTPEAPAFDDDANVYAKRLQEVGKQVVRNRQRARSSLVSFLGMVLVIPLLVTALFAPIRNLRGFVRLNPRSH